MAKRRRPGRPPGQARRVNVRRREGDPRGLQVYHRLANGGAVALGLDPRILSEPSKLEMRGLITARQREAMHKVGTIYQTWYRWHSRRPIPGTSSLEGRVHAHDSISELFDGDVSLSDVQNMRRAEIEEIIHKVEERYRKLQECLRKMRRDNGAWIGRAKPGWEGHIADLIYRLCVENLAIADREVEMILPTVDLIAAAFNVDRAQAARNPIAITARKRPLSQRRKPHLAREAFLACAARLRPDASRNELEEAYEGFQTLLARERFRQDKAVNEKLRR